MVLLDKEKAPHMAKQHLTTSHSFRHILHETINISLNDKPVCGGGGEAGIASIVANLGSTVGMRSSLKRLKNTYRVQGLHVALYGLPSGELT